MVSRVTPCGGRPSPGPASLLPQQKPADKKSQPDQCRPFVAEEVRPELENILRQQTRQRDSESDDGERDQDVADQSGMPAFVELIHPRMPPPTPEFFKQKLLPSS